MFFVETDDVGVDQGVASRLGGPTTFVLGLEVGPEICLGEEAVG